jgi:hypothetical protein
MNQFIVAATLFLCKWVDNFNDEEKNLCSLILIACKYGFCLEINDPI